MTRRFHASPLISDPRYSRREFLQRAAGAGASLGAMATALARTPGQQLTAGKPRRQLHWQIHPVARIPHGYQVAVGDVNGDGRKDILALSSEESVVEWYEAPSWEPHPVTTRTQGNISLAPLAGRDGKFRGLALATDFVLEDSTRGGKVWWLERIVHHAGAYSGVAQTVSPNSLMEGEWRLSLVGQIPTSHRLRWGNLLGDGRPRLVDCPILGSGAKPPEYNVGAPLTWFESPDEFTLPRPGIGRNEPGPPWKPHLIDDSLTVVHGINVFDWDGDGRDEILTASFEGVHLFHSTGENLRWTKIQLAAGDQSAKLVPAGAAGNASGQAAEIHRGSSEIGVGKVAGRRFLATIEPWHGHQVVVYVEGRRGELWTRRVIDTSLRDGHALACADLDGDGNDEILAGFRGPGTSLFAYYAGDSSGADWERQTLDTDMAASGVVIADLNGDGRLDVVAVGASTGNVKWYENLGDG